MLGASFAVALVLAACTPQKSDVAPAPEAAAPVAAIPYGANPAASGTFTHDGVTLYYETYGQGEPLLLVHGNGGSIGRMAAQIDFFKAHYQVIAMDSREQGKSGDSADPIKYEKMTDDLAALLEHLKAGPANVLGWSDGGIEALLLCVRHPDKVKKLAAMAANLNPSLAAVYPETDAFAKTVVSSMPEEVRNTPQGKRELKVASLMSEEPHIDPAMLGKITAPTLILSGDQDLIRLEHTVTIFNSVPNANLAIFPNSTHMVPYDDPALFNGTLQRFFQTPFQKKDRVGDVLSTFEKLLAGLAR